MKDEQGSYRPLNGVEMSHAGLEVGPRFRVRMTRFGGVEDHPAAAARLPERRYPLLRRIATRIPGARNMMRFTRTLQRRYLPS